MKSPESYSTLVAVLAFFLCGIVLIVLNLSVQDTIKYTHPDIDLQRVLIECGITVALLFGLYLVWRAHEDRKAQAKEGTSAGGKMYRLPTTNVLDPVKHPGSGAVASPDTGHVAINMPSLPGSSSSVFSKTRTRRS